MGPTFVISLDFELFWGVLESKTLTGYSQNILGAHDAIPAMLDMFDAYRVKTTFATVGFLFQDNSSELRNRWPTVRPRYKNSRLSSYDYPFEDGPMFFAPDLIKRLTNSPQHEIATHTFSHYYCGAEGAELRSFQEDLEKALSTGRERGIDQTSIVFPRNQVLDQFLAVCHAQGLRCFRGNQTSWVYRTQKRKFLGRLLRFADSYLNLSGDNCQSWLEVRHPSGLANVRASAMLRPHRPRQPWLDRLQIRRIKSAMEKAAQRGTIYHLWWHPHNFGTHLQENLRNLESVLLIFQRLSEDYGMVSRTMREVAECSVK